MLMKKIIFTLLFVLVSISLLFAQEDPTGLSIIEKVYHRPTGKDMKAELSMTLVNSRGDQRERKIQQFIKYGNDVDKKIMFFLAPADVRNTSFMNWSYNEAGKDDDQWIYLPALKRIKRISSGSKSDYFMGSDFAYDDLGDRHPSEDSHKLLRKEKIGDEECFVIESTPKQKNYMYSTTVTWVIDGKWIGLKKRFYDEDGEHLKTLQVKKYEKTDDYWTILETEMHNVQKNHTTRMQLNNVDYDTGITDDMFTERTMKRGVR